MLVKQLGKEGVSAVFAVIHVIPVVVIPLNPRGQGTAVWDMEHAKHRFPFLFPQPGCPEGPESLP